MTWNRWSPVDDPGEMKRVGDSLETIARQLGLGSPGLVASVFGDWEAIVGSVLAAHSRPERLHEGELTVSVDEPAWATEVRFLSADIVARINDRRGSDAVSSVAVVVRRSGPGNGARKGGGNGSVGRGKPSDDQQAGGRSAGSASGKSTANWRERSAGNSTGKARPDAGASESSTPVRPSRPNSAPRGRGSTP